MALGEERLTEGTNLTETDFQHRVDWWLKFLRHRENINLEIEVSAISDTKREEIQIRARGRLVMIGLVRTGASDDDAIEITAQTVIADLLNDHQRGYRSFFVAYTHISFFTLEQEDDCYRFAPIRQSLDPNQKADLAKIREMFPQLISQNARQLMVPLELEHHVGG